MTGRVLEQIANEIALISPRVYRLRGEPKSLPDVFAVRFADRDVWNRHIGWALGRVIYQLYYLGSDMTDASGEPAKSPVSVYGQSHPEFSTRLRNANSGAGWLNPRWEVTAIHETGFLVKKKGVTLVARRDEVEPESATHVEVGCLVRVKFPKHFPYISPGYYTAISDSGPARRNVVRVYVDVSADGAPDVLRAATEFVNSGRLPAMVKVVSHPDRFSRPDSLVMYLDRVDFSRCREKLAQRFSEFLGRTIGTRSPGFAFAWFPGIGVAEEPPKTPAVESFGEHRSRHIACGLAKSFSGSNRDPVPASERLAILRRHLVENQLDPDRLYLNPGSCDILASFESYSTTN